jgi:hypothetical protein
MGILLLLHYTPKIKAPARLSRGFRPSQRAVTVTHRSELASYSAGARRYAILQNFYKSTLGQVEGGYQTEQGNNTIFLYSVCQLLLDVLYIMVYTKPMKIIHPEKPTKRIEIGKPFERAIRDVLMPKTNTGNLSSAWDYTDWVRFALAEQLKRAGNLPAECAAMLPRFYKDLDL